MKFQPNDLLRIHVSTKDNVGVTPFNLTTSSFLDQEGFGGERESPRAYLINQDGNIDFPVLGKVKIAGKTKQEVIEILKLKLDPYLTNPLIHIDLVSFRVSVLGDVSKPGIFSIPNERVTILEAIAMAGDLNISGKRDDVTVIRETDGVTSFLKINLLDDSLFDSPAYFLNQNDVVYVKPNNIKTREASWESRIPLITSISTFVLSVVILIIR